MFSNAELLSIVTNLFDISMTECDNTRDNSSLYFNLDTRDTGLLLQMEYCVKEGQEMFRDPSINFLPELLLKQSLSRFGGYSTTIRQGERVRRKVMLPYAGKAYILKDANTPR